MKTKSLFRSILTLVFACLLSVNLWADEEYDEYNEIRWGKNALYSRACDENGENCITNCQVPSPRVIYEWLTPAWKRISYCATSPLIEVCLANDTILYVKLSADYEGYDPSSAGPVVWEIKSSALLSAVGYSRHGLGTNANIKRIIYQVNDPVDITITSKVYTTESYGFYHDGATVEFHLNAPLNITGEGCGDFVAVWAKNIIIYGGGNEFTTNGQLLTDGTIGGGLIEMHNVNLKTTFHDRNEYIDHGGAIESLLFKAEDSQISTTGNPYYGIYANRITLKNSTVNVPNSMTKAIRAYYFTLDGCEITTPANATFNSTYGTVYSNGLPATELLINPSVFPLYINGEQVTAYTATHSSDFTYYAEDKTLYLKKNITGGIKSGVQGLIIRPSTGVDSVTISGSSYGLYLMSDATATLSAGANKVIHVRGTGLAGIGVKMGYKSQLNISDGYGTGKYYIYGKIFGIAGTSSTATAEVNLKVCEMVNVKGDSIVTAKIASFDVKDMTLKGYLPNGSAPVFVRGSWLTTVLNLNVSNPRQGTTTIVKPITSLTYAMETYNLWVNGVQVNGFNRGNIQFDAGVTSVGSISNSTGSQITPMKIYYTPSTKTLTIQNCEIRPVNNYAIRSNIDGFILEVLGDNKIYGASINSQSGWSCIRMDKNATITGGGSLYLDAPKSGIGLYLYADQTNYANKDLTVLLSDVNLTAKGMYGIGGMYNNYKTHGGVLVVDNSVVSATANGYKRTPTYTGASIGLLHNLDVTTYNNCRVTQPDQVFFYADSGAVVGFTSEMPIVRSEIIIEPQSYNLWVAGTQVTYTNRNNIVCPYSTGSVTYNDKTHTLTLNNFQYIDTVTSTYGQTKEGIVSQFTQSVLNQLLGGSTLNIELIGDNIIRTGNNAIRSKDNLVFFGTGSLTLLPAWKNAGDMGIIMEGSRTVTIQGGAHLSCSGWNYGLYGGSDNNAKLVIDSAFVNAQGYNGGIVDWSKFTLKGHCAITSPAGAVFDTDERRITKDGHGTADTIVIRPMHYYVAGTLPGTSWTAPYTKEIDGSITFELEAAQAYEFRITEGDGVHPDYGYSYVDQSCSSSNVLEGYEDNNIKLISAKQQTITITFNGSTICVKGDFLRTLNKTSYTIMGDFGLTENAWSPTDAAYDMTPNADSTSWTLRKYGVELNEGSYFYKVVGNHSAILYQFPEGDGQELQVPATGLYDVIFTYRPNIYAPWLTAELIPTDRVLQGMFSISADKQVSFSKGNLQYQPSTNTWQFAQHQYDVIGEDNKYISPTYNGWIDLFGWGTGNHPTDTSKVNSDYLEWVDWGVNPIRNGGNLGGMWRTMSYAEAKYLFEERPNASLLYSEGVVNDTWGLIVLPDDWTLPDGLSFTPRASNFYDNRYAGDDWIKMENAGAVFLPDSYSRRGTVMESGSTLYHTADAALLWWRSAEVRFDESNGPSCRWYGISVRLIRDTIIGCETVYGDTLEMVAPDSYTWNSQTYTESGEYQQTLKNAQGCDSIATLYLTIVDPLSINPQDVYYRFDTIYPRNARVAPVVGVGPDAYVSELEGVVKVSKYPFKNDYGISFLGQDYMYASHYAFKEIYSSPQRVSVPAEVRRSLSLNVYATPENPAHIYLIVYSPFESPGRLSIRIPSGDVLPEMNGTSGTSMVEWTVTETGMYHVMGAFSILEARVLYENNATWQAMRKQTSFEFTPETTLADTLTTSFFKIGSPSRIEEDGVILLGTTFVGRGIAFKPLVEGRIEVEGAIADTAKTYHFIHLDSTTAVRSNVVEQTMLEAWDRLTDNPPTDSIQAHTFARKVYKCSDTLNATYRLRGLNTIVTAVRFIPDRYTVTLDANGGTVNPNELYYLVDGGTPIDSFPTPVNPEAVSFDGWYDADGHTPTFPLVPTADITYTARWTMPVPGRLTWRADDEDIKGLGTIAADTTIRGLTFVATANKTIVVDANKKTYNDTLVFTHRIKLGGGMGADYRYLKFDVPGDCELEVYCISSSSAEERDLRISAGTYDNTIKQWADVTGTGVNRRRYFYTGPATTIFLGSENLGINILGIHLVPGAEQECTDVAVDAYAEAQEYYPWNNVAYYHTGEYTHTYVTAHGCDSIVTLHLTITGVPEVPNELEVAYVCDFTKKAYSKNQNYDATWVYDDSWTVFGGSTYKGTWDYCKFGGKGTTLETANPVYVGNVLPFRRDIKAVRVTYHAGSLNNDQMSVNDWGVETYLSNEYIEPDRTSVLLGSDVPAPQPEVRTIEVDQTWGECWAAGSYFRVYWNINNPTTINGVVNVEKIEFLADKRDCQDVTSEFSASALTSYTWNAETYNKSGDYVQTFPLASGCDSIVTLHLTITLPDTLNVAQAMQLYNSLSLATGVQSADTYVVRGYVTNWKSGYPSYQNADFYIDDAADGSQSLLECYRLTAELAADQRKLNVGDYIEAKGYLKNYNGRAEIVNGTFRVLEAAPQPQAEDKGDIAVSEFLALQDILNIYHLTGTVSGLPEDTTLSAWNYGVFNLTDATGTVLIYGLLTPDSVAFQFRLLDVENEDIVTLKGVYTTYKSTPEMRDAVFISRVKHVATSVEPAATTDDRQRARKVLINGDLYIIMPDGRRYTILGAEVR